MAQEQEAAATDNFIRKDVFDARMDRMEMLLEKTLTGLQGEIRENNARIEAKIDKEVTELRNEMKTEVSALHNEMRAENEKLRNEVKAEISGLRDEMKAEVSGLRDEMKVEISGLRDEMRVNNARLETKIEVVTTQVDFLQTWQYWQLTWVGIFIALLAFLPAVVRYIDKKSEAAASKERIFLGHLSDQDKDLRRR